jgi:hypothetical protein
MIGRAMAIAPSGQFVYTALVSRTLLGKWAGEAVAPADANHHPGLVGKSPRVELRGGRIKLRRTEPWLLRRQSPHYGTWGPPASRVTFRVGDTIERILKDRDELTVSRGGAGDLAITVVREGTLRAALGAIAHRQLDSGIKVDTDPRALAQPLYGLAEELERPDTQLVWLDASDPESQAHVRKVTAAPGPRVVVASAGSSPEGRRRLLDRLASERLGSFSSCSFFDVGAEFATPEAWLTYLRGLPTLRPHDLWIRISIGTEAIALHEDEYAFVSGWHLYVLKVWRCGIPGEPSQLAIVRASASVSDRNVMESTRLLASGDIAIREWP